MGVEELERADASATGVRIKRAYAPADPGDGWRVLVDRLWPRGLRRETLALDEWRPELAPTARLRRWFGHEPSRWEEFRRRYRAELSDAAVTPALEGLIRRARRGPVTLVYSARDEDHNQAVVLAEVIRERVTSAAGGVDLVEAVDRLVRGGVAVTTRALLEHPAVELTLQQWRVLVLVVDAGDGIRITDIGIRVGASVPSASRLVARLQERGLVVSSRDPADGRATLVRATAHGDRVATAVLERRRRMIAVALEPRIADAPAGLIEVIDGLADALEHLS